MEILNQIRKSQLSKQGQTNPTGVFEGVPSNVAAVQRSANGIPRAATVISPLVNPIDVTFNSKQQPTYLDYLKTSNKL